MAGEQLFCNPELAFRTQYVELNERVNAEQHLLPDTPGSLSLRTGTGFPYSYRALYPVPNKQAEGFAGRHARARENIENGHSCAKNGLDSQAIPYYGYLLEAPEPGAELAAVLMESDAMARRTLTGWPRLR